MEVFEFDKTLLTRMIEAENVLRLNTNPIPASSVRREWSYFVEVQIEPAGKDIFFFFKHFSTNHTP